MPIKKIACYTDIHFGRRSNSIMHNQDCLDFIEWFCDNVKKDPEITHIAFLGDFFENRSAINIHTLEMAYQGLQMLDKLGLPIIHIVGNHDLHRRTTREIHSVNIFSEMKNFTIVDKPMIVDGSCFVPFIFPDEYVEYYEMINNSEYVYGHFEFKDFIITGYNMTMKHGPDHRKFSGPKKIYSGHFHKRQQQNNVHYIGNTFPADFGDANDNNRGMCVVDQRNNTEEYINWKDCPKYYKTSLSKIVNNDWTPLSKMRVECLFDIEMIHSDANILKEELVSLYDLREFSFDEVSLKKDALESEKDVDLQELESKSIDEIVIDSLETIDDVANIKNEKLVRIYKSLEVKNV